MSRAREAGGTTVTICVRVTPRNRAKIERTAKALGGQSKLGAGVRWLIDNAPEMQQPEVSNASGRK